MSSLYLSSRSVINSTLKSDSESVDAITYRKIKDFDDSWPSDIVSAATCHPVSAIHTQINKETTARMQALLSATFPRGLMNRNMVALLPTSLPSGLRLRRLSRRSQPRIKTHSENRSVSLSSHSSIS
uniref:Uncharacterized protein n=1 Tax=Ditylenchus dipsaci TaxID=166011 RepID=A0A915CN81_9BILA